MILEKDFIDFIGIHDLIKNKRAVGRKRDIDDLARLQEKIGAPRKKQGKGPGKKK